MNAVYRYALKKYLKSWSTWVICLISILIVVILGGFVPFHFKKISTAADYARTIVIVVASVSSFISLFTSVFAGFKGATMLRDEADDGTLLIMLSKPITRQKLFFAKWLALQTIIIGYTFIIALSFLVTLLVADRTHISSTELESLGIKKISKTIIPVSALLWFVISIVALIFSSLSLLISSKFTVGATIGTSIAIGVVVPTTMLIGIFAGTPEYKNVSTTSISDKSVVLDQRFGDFSFSNKVADLESEPSSLYNMGFSTGDKDGFKTLQIFDVDYHIKKMSEMASEASVSRQTRDSIDFSKSQYEYKNGTSIADTNNPLKLSTSNDIQQFVTLVKGSWELTQGYRNELLIDIFDKIYRSNLTSTHSLRFPRADFTSEFYDIDDSNKEIFNISFLKPYIHDKNADYKQIILDNNKSIQSEFALLLAYYFSYANKVQTYDDFDYSYSYDVINRLLSKKIEAWYSEDIAKSLGDNEVFKREVQMLIDLSHPLSFWLDLPKMRQARIDMKYEFDPESRYFDLHGDTPEMDSLTYLKSMVDTDITDAKAFYEITSALKAGHDVVRVKNIEYSNKYTIVLIYLAIALGLVHLAYWVIRKQDYR